MGKQAEKTGADKRHEAILLEAHENFGISLEAWDANRKAYLDDLTIAVATDQWDEQTKRARGKNRPALTVNKLNGVTKQIIGDYRKNEIGIKVRPVDDGADVQQAKIRDGIIRNIQDVSRAQDAYVAGLECAVRGGYGFIKLDTDYVNDDDFDLDIRVRRITNPLSIYPYPFYREAVGQDMLWCFEVETISQKEFEKKYPDHKPADWKASSGEDWYDDWYPGIDGKDGVRIANYWRVETEQKTVALLKTGERVVIESEQDRQKLLNAGIEIEKERAVERRRIRCYKLCGHAVIEEYDFPGKYIPIVVVPGEEIDMEGKRIFRSSISYAKDPQHIYNYSKSAAVETVALQPKTPWTATPKQMLGHEHLWKTANTGDHQVLPYNADPQASGPPQRQSPPQTAVAEISMAMGAADDIKSTTGLYDRSLGAAGAETSGKAILAVQQEGDTATFIFLDNTERAIQHVGTIINEMLPEVYDTERVVRLLQRDGASEMATVNKVVLDPATAEYVTLNDLTVGKFDVTVTTGPAFATQRQEGATFLTEMVRGNPKLLDIAGDLVFKSMDFPYADEIAERFRRIIPPHVLGEDAPQQQPNPEQQRATAMQQEAQEMAHAAATGEARASIAQSAATVEKAKADTVKAKAGAAKSVVELQSTVTQARANALRGMLQFPGPATMQ